MFKGKKEVGSEEDEGGGGGGAVQRARHGGGVMGFLGERCGGEDRARFSRFKRDLRER